jgi:hypothetical protein
VTTVFCGIDWAETHHDVALVDTEGRLLARCRIADDLAGLETLIELLAKHADGRISVPRPPLARREEE